MKLQHDVKTFIQALHCYPDNIRKFSSYLLDKRLSQIEKKILMGWLRLRDRQFDIAIAELSDLSSPHPIVESQRELVLGIAHNNSAAPQNAVPHLMRAADLIANGILPREYFTALFQLGLAYLNLKDRHGVENVLDRLDDVSCHSINETINMARLTFNYFSFIGDYKHALLHLRTLESNATHMSGSQRCCVHIDKFIFYLKQTRFSDCYRVLDEMKSARKFFLGENYSFMKNILDFVSDARPLYLYTHEYEGHPLLFHQAHVLLALEKHEMATAQTHWNALHAMSPHVYRDSFLYDGDPGLFSMALEKIKADRRPHSALPSHPKRAQTPEDILLQLFEQSDGRAIAKEELYRVVYGRDLESKDDLFKLANAIQRLKKKYHLDIKSSKGTFVLIGKKVA